MLPHQCLHVKSQPTIKMEKREIKPTKKNRVRQSSTELKVNIIELAENQRNLSKLIRHE